jgi:uncharacterized membrane protein YvbJ
VTCPSCGTSNAVGAKFCSECGTRFATSCPACGAVNLPGAKFCSECGTPAVGGGRDGGSGCHRGACPVRGAGQEPGR